MRNRPEYGELMAACFKGRLIHVNINYRYVAEEVFYIFDDPDSEVIVYSSEFRDCIVGAWRYRPRKYLYTFVEIGEASQIAPFAIPYETLAQEGDGSALGIVRSPEDQAFHTASAHDGHAQADAASRPNAQSTARGPEAARPRSSEHSKNTSR